MCSVTVLFFTSLSTNLSEQKEDVCLQLPFLLSFLYRLGKLLSTESRKVNLTVMFSSDVPLTVCVDSTEIKKAHCHFKMFNCLMAGSHWDN